MVETSIMYPSNVKQPLVNTQKQNPFSCCIRALGRDNRYEGVYCDNRSDPRYYHEWTNAMELTRGGEIQCGRPSNYYCNHRTYYDIAGYRNTCPIAGCSGTYFQPAVLQLEFSKAHLASYGIIEGTEMHDITLTFNHRCLGVDVSNSQTSTNWGPNFCGFDKYPDLKVLKMYVTDKNNVIKGNVYVHNENPPLRGYAGVTVTFHNISYNDIAEGCINIEYQRNLSTNPGNIYIKDLQVKMNYTNAYPYMKGYNEVVDVYMSNIQRCQTQFRHIIDVGYENKSGKIPLSKAPKDLRNGIIVNVPDGVTYTTNRVEDSFVEFYFTDNSGIEGVKNIVYTHKDLPNEMIIFGYEAKKYPQPLIMLLHDYYRNSKFTEQSLMMSGEKTCVDKIEFYVNGFDSDPFVTLTASAGDFNEANTKDMITNQGKEKFHNAITNLPCGRYELFIKMNDSHDYTWGRFVFTIHPAQYAFEVTVKTQEAIDDNPTTPLDFFHYVQNKQNDIRLLSIKRVDNFNERSTPHFLIKTDCNYKNTEPSELNTINRGLQVTLRDIQKGDTLDFDISVKYPGRYNFIIQDRTDSKYCKMYEEKRYIDIEPNHKQNHDVLFVRGEDSTSFEYDYLVAWEGDNIDEPIHVSDIDIGQSFDDILLCVESTEFFTGLSQIGVAKLRVTNNSNKTLNNIRIELNALNENDVTLDEFLDVDGVFVNLYENFNKYNALNGNNVQLLNLTPDNDNIGEENVEILIKTLEYDDEENQGDSIEILIPFMSRSDKTVKVQPLIFEEPCKIYTYDDCASKDNPIDSFNVTVYDSILTNLTIEGETDLLDINHSIACPNECFTTDLTYKIQNIDSSSTEKILAKTKIVNDANLIPYKFKYKQDGREIIQTVENLNSQVIDDNIKVDWIHSERIKTKELSKVVIVADVHFPNHQQYYVRARTDTNGRVAFFIDIPTTVSRNYTLSKLLKEVLTFRYAGNTEHQNGILYIDNKGDLINTVDNNNDERNKVFINYEKTYRRYKPGETIKIVLAATYQQKVLENNIIFYPDIHNVGQSDELTVSYKACNIQTVNLNKYNQPEIKYNQGKLTTTFQTDDYQLIENQISQDIYLGLETDLSSKVAIDRRLVEQEQLNIIDIQIDNKKRDNKDVKCLIDLGPYPNKLLGEYNIVGVDVDDGSSDIIVKDDKTSIQWIIGEMKEDTNTHAQIILKGVEVGLSEITTTIYDYQHSGEEKDYHFGEKRCTC